MLSSFHMYLSPMLLHVLFHQQILEQIWTSMVALLNKHNNLFVCFVQQINNITIKWPTKQPTHGQLTTESWRTHDRLDGRFMADLWQSVGEEATDSWSTCVSWSQSPFLPLRAVHKTNQNSCLCLPVFSGLFSVFSSRTYKNCSKLSIHSLRNL